MGVIQNSKVTYPGWKKDHHYEFQECCANCLWHTRLNTHDLCFKEMNPEKRNLGLTHPDGKCDLWELGDDKC